MPDSTIFGKSTCFFDTKEVSDCQILSIMYECRVYNTLITMWNVESAHNIRIDHYTCCQLGSVSSFISSKL